VVVSATPTATPSCPTIVARKDYQSTPEHQYTRRCGALAYTDTVEGWGIALVM